jgi:hypothetical protein
MSIFSCCGLILCLAASQWIADAVSAAGDGRPSAWCWAVAIQYLLIVGTLNHYDSAPLVDSFGPAAFLTYVVRMYFFFTPELYSHLARYIDKIFKGVTPGELPVEQPMKFELVINLSTAKTLGLAIPQSLMLRANEVVK